MRDPEKARARRRRWVAKNPDYNRVYLRRMRENRAIFIAQALAGGCVDCGIKDMRVLEFDHVRGAKKGNPWQMGSVAVRCANCHAIKTRERGQAGRAA